MCAYVCVEGGGEGLRLVWSGLVRPDVFCLVWCVRFVWSGGGVAWRTVVGFGLGMAWGFYLLGVSARPNRDVRRVGGVFCNGMRLCFGQLAAP